MTLTTAETAAATIKLGYAAFEIDYGDGTLHWSAGAAKTLGLEPGELPATLTALTRMLPAKSRARRLPATPPLKLPAQRSGADYRIRYLIKPAPDRGTIDVEEEGCWIGNPGETPTGCAGLLRAIERPLSAAAVERARHDRPDDEGLLARDDLFAVLDGAIANLVRGKASSAVFMLIAVDDIGRINANFGYETGDRVIALVAERIARRMRQGDVLGHLSGHKFGAILFNCDEAAFAPAANRFRTAVGESPTEAGGAVIRCQVSIGGVLLPRHASDVSTAIIRTEEALADARTDADCRQRLYQPSASRDAERRRNVGIADEINRGLEDGRFILAYQPIADANDHRLLSYEALSRLVLADGKVVSGGPYISVAETLGLVRRIDQRVLTQVIADLAACPRLRLSVNASVESLLDPSWLTTLLDTARSNREVLGRLTVEITETAAMACVDDIVHLAGTLREIGCKVAIDDFGSGHTSFRVLRELRPDWLKIDGAFIRNLATDPDSMVFVDTLMTFARHFGIRTIAEFVQDEISTDRLRQVGVTAFQGRYIGEPLLRMLPSTETLLSGRTIYEDRESDGYPSYAGILSGEIAVS